jgi:glycosyltransferase involved in cell wall biosynthesis
MDLIQQVDPQYNIRRLAVIDTMFPWAYSGFRYWENFEIYRQRPDTLFFATTPHKDEFPAEVHHVSRFTSIAKTEGITDLYCVFLNLALSIVGDCSLPNGTWLPGCIPELNIRSFLESQGVRLHTTIYPGGGFDPTTPKEFLSKAANYYSTIFSNAKEVLEYIPKSVYMPGVINTTFYQYHQKPDTRPLQLTFCANNSQRKGFPYVAKAFNQLDDHYHLNIIGDWQNLLHLLTNRNYTFYGMQSPQKLNSIYNHSHVFISASSSDQFALDGFPTTAAADAMATGCLLVSTNSRNDHFVFDGNIDYLEIYDDDVSTLVDTLVWVNTHFQEAMQIARNGAQKVRERFDFQSIVKQKLDYIFN